MKGMKALTISQPWADLIRKRQKWVENRHWPTNHRGTLAIHAGLGKQYLTKEELAKFTTGAVVAITEVVACLYKPDAEKVDPDTEIEGTRYTVGEVLSHQYSEGPYLWVLDNTRAIEPVQATGRQSLWLWVPSDELCYLEEVS